MKTLIIIFVSLALVLTSCTSKPDVIQNGIEIAQTRLVIALNSEETTKSDMAAVAYMQIKNTATSPDQLMGVSADFGDASLHETRMNGDIMLMDPIAAIEFPAGALVELRSGSYHIMITNLKPGIKLGDTVQLTLQFEKAGNVIIPTKVTKP